MARDMESVLYKKLKKYKKMVMTVVIYTSLLQSITSKNQLKCEDNLTYNVMSDRWIDQSVG